MFYFLHSWLRWAVFAAGLVAILYPLYGLVRRRPYARVMWTIAGLFAAIPATIFYNWFVNRTAHLTHRMDTFSLELANIVQRRIAQGG